jgi:hypothetical protein
MKVTVSINTADHEIMNIIGDLQPCIIESKRACTFRISTVKTDYEIGEKETQSLKDIVIQAITNEGLEYYYKNNKDNILMKCPYREKTVKAFVSNEGDKIKLEIGGKTFDV